MAEWWGGAPMWRWWSQHALLARRQGTGASRPNSENPPDESFCALLEVVRNLSFQWFCFRKGYARTGKRRVKGETREKETEKGGDTFHQTEAPPSHRADILGVIPNLGLGGVTYGNVLKRHGLRCVGNVKCLLFCGGLLAWGGSKGREGMANSDDAQRDRKTTAIPSCPSR